MECQWNANGMPWLIHDISGMERFLWSFGPQSVSMTEQNTIWFTLWLFNLAMENGP